MPDPLAPLPDMSNSWNMPMPTSFGSSDGLSGSPTLSNFDGSGLPGMATGGGGAGAGGIFGTGMGGLDFAKTAIGGVGTLANIWNAWQGMKMARKQFNFTRNFANANLANQTKTYNTNLADREGSRAVMEGLTPQQAQSYIASNSLSAPHL